MEIQQSQADTPPNAYCTKLLRPDLLPNTPDMRIEANYNPLAGELSNLVKRSYLSLAAES